MMQRDREIDNADAILFILVPLVQFPKAFSGFDPPHGLASAVINTERRYVDEVLRCQHPEPAENFDRYDGPCAFVVAVFDLHGYREPRGPFFARQHTAEPNAVRPDL